MCETFSVPAPLDRWRGPPLECYIANYQGSTHIYPPTAWLLPNTHTHPHSLFYSMVCLEGKRPKLQLCQSESTRHHRELFPHRRELRGPWDGWWWEQEVGRHWPSGWPSMYRYQYSKSSQYWTKLNPVFAACVVNSANIKWIIPSTVQRAL